MPLMEEVRDFKFWKAVRTEFLASVLLVLVGCGSIVTSSPSPSPHPGEEVKVGLAFGLCVATLCQCCGPVSGAHANPAITLAMLVARHLSVLRCACYVLAQCVGAVCGAAILYGLTPAVEGAAARQLGVTRLSANVTSVQGFGVEFFSSFLYVFSYMSNVDTKRQDMGSRALYIGLTVTLVHLFAYRVTGASVNPARSLGPAVITNSWHQHWVYWFGPLLAAFIAALTYEYTEESSMSFQSIRQRFKDKPPLLELPRTLSLARSRSQLSANSTEMTLATDDGRLPTVTCDDGRLPTVTCDDGRLATVTCDDGRM